MAILSGIMFLMYSIATSWCTKETPCRIGPGLGELRRIPLPRSWVNKGQQAELASSVGEEVLRTLRFAAPLVLLYANVPCQPPLLAQEVAAFAPTSGRSFLGFAGAASSADESSRMVGCIALALADRSRCLSTPNHLGNPDCSCRPGQSHRR
jgi:hypothetical protein